MIEHFITRLDLINWLIAHCTRKYIVRALENNKVEFLGGFDLIPPWNLPGWIFTITKLSKQKEHICILANDKNQKYKIGTIKNVPWEKWYGLILTTGLNIGDNPHKYKELYDASKSDRQNQSK